MGRKSGSSAFVVLLRGINVGRANRVPMADFRQLLERLDYRNVATLLNSGNAVFSADSTDVADHTRRITEAMEAGFGLRLSVIVMPSATLDRVVATCPFVVDEAEHSRFLVAFAMNPDALSGLAPLADLITPPEQFAIGQDAAYLHCASGILESKVAAAMLGKIGKEVTTRNLATVLKLQCATTRIRKLG